MKIERFMTKAVNPFRRVASPYRRAYAVMMTTWVTASGFDWAADRAKCIIQYLIQLRAGQAGVMRPIWVASRWLSYPERVALKGNDAQFIELIQVLRCYTLLGYTKAEVTKKDEEKFVTAVTGLPESEFIKVTKPMSSLSLARQVPDLFGLFRSILSECTGGVLTHAKWREMKGIMSSLIVGRGVVPFPNMFSLAGKHFEEYVGAHFIMDMTSNGWKFSNDKKNAPYTTLPWVFASHPPIGVDVDMKYKTHAGSIFHRVQTDGKVRYFYAAPDWMQFVLRPWAKVLFRSLRSIGNDCTFRQELGVELCTQWLREGRRVWSYDLSSATDRFPLVVITRILSMAREARNWHSWLHTFYVCSTLPVRFKSMAGRVRTLRWRCGQPLGTIASFPAFALSHHWVVRALSLMLGASNRYAILGDDVIIADDELAAAYSSFMSKIGVEISLQKSVSSPVVGEFAGRVIGPQAFGFKLKYPVPTLRSLPMLINLIGPKALKWLPQSRMRDAIALLPIGHSPGYNPGGFRQDKVDEFLRIYYSLEKDPDLVYPEPVVGTARRTEVKSEILPLFSAVPPDRLDTEPRGSLSQDEYGAPDWKGVYSPAQEWRYTAFMSRKWLSRVRTAVRGAQL